MLYFSTARKRVLGGPSMNPLAPSFLRQISQRAVFPLSPLRLVSQAFLSQGEPGVKLYLGGEYPPQGAPADNTGGVS